MSPKNPGRFAPFLNVPERKPQDEMIEVDHGDVEVVQPQPAVQAISFPDYSRMLTDAICIFLTMRPEAETPEIRIKFEEDWAALGQMVAMRLGYQPGMAVLAQPKNAEKLPGALEALLRNAEVIRRKVPVAFDAIDLNELRLDGVWLNFVRRVGVSHGVLDHGGNVLDANLGQSLAGRLHQVHERVWGAIQHLPKLVDDLMPLHDLFTASAQQGVETRKAKEEAAAAAEARVMAKLGQGGTPAGGSGTPAGASQPVPPPTPVPSTSPDKKGGSHK